ncbi:MAG: polysaccharide biosynthesis/export family protein, partial [Bacteroidales bacterium]
ILYFVLSAVFFTSCGILNSNEMFKVPSNYKFSEFKPNEKEYKIQPFDKLDVKIFYNNGVNLIEPQSNSIQQNSIEYNVEYDGLVKLPSLGRVALAGLTIRQAEDLLEQKYKEFMIDPFVKINVTNKRIIVFTNGSSSGKVITLKNDNYTLIEALAESGGISDQTKSYKIKLLRGDLNNPDIYLFNLKKVSNMKDFNFILQANDIIYVEARPRYASKILSELTPYLSLFSSALLIYSLFK